MNHKVTLFLLAASALICSSLAEAQQPKKVPRIGYLSNTDRAGESARSEAIRRSLRELGYVEGQNIAIEYRACGLAGASQG
jgi:putative ABC transport system substrate-binding protein